MEDWPNIVAQHSQIVWQAAFRLLGSQADAADCVQETFAAAVRVSRREDVRSWPALLHRLGKTQALCILRRRLRQRKYLNTTEMPEVRDAAPGPVDQAQASETAEALRIALAKLPQQQAMVFSLRFLDDLSYDQIAEAMGLSSNAVGVLIHRARCKLRQLMAETSAAGKFKVQHD